MPRLPRVSSKKLIQALLRAGFFEHHQSGSHVSLRHETKKHLRITIPYHSRELAPKTLKSILAQTELTIQELIELL